MALARYEADPQARQAPLARELVLARARDDADLVAGVVALMDLVGSAGKYTVPISGAQGVQVGDHNTQVSFFIREPADRGPTGASPDKPVGRVLNQVIDPFTLEVHRPVQAVDPPPGLSVLPVYLPREHDAQLAERMEAAAEGTSGIAVLVGGSSTGKTRACWEALDLLRRRPETWRLWHPIDPARPEAALRELPLVGPRTVVWLNEAQFYLDVPDGGVGEQVAAGLRELLRDPDRTPVLVLATLWPGYWDALTARPAAGADLHAQARELLAGRDITVPAAFTPAQLEQVAGAGDPRLARAARAAEGGQVIQFLAGAPELMARYRNAPPAAAALISAAMDARRLGMDVALPLAFLEAAAPGYLNDTDWDGLGEDWLEQGLAYTAAPCKGIRGPLARIRPRPGAGPGPDGGPAYRLADYLDQHGRHTRQEEMGPASLWDSFVAHAPSGRDIERLADAAHKRGLYRYAAALWTKATATGDPHAAGLLLGVVYGIDPNAAEQAARWAVQRVSLDAPWAVAWLLEVLSDGGFRDAVRALLARDLINRMNLERPADVYRLAQALRAAGADDTLKSLASQSIGRLKLDDPDIPLMLDKLTRVGIDATAFSALASWLSTCIPLEAPHTVAGLLSVLRDAGAHDAVLALLGRDPVSRVNLDEPFGIAALLSQLHKAGAREAIAALLARDPVSRVSLKDPDAVANLVLALCDIGAQDALEALLARDPGGTVSLEHADAVARLLRALRATRVHDASVSLLARLGQVTLENMVAADWLLSELQDTGKQEAFEALAARAVNEIKIEEPRDVDALLGTLSHRGPPGAVEALLARDPASNADLTDPGSVGYLLEALHGVGAREALITLANRVAWGIIPDSHSLELLLIHLRRTGCEEAARTLVTRAVDEGDFSRFLQSNVDEAPEYFAGREPDGSPSKPWTWQPPSLA